MSFLFGVFVGFMVGWNIIPQPEFMRRLFVWVEQKVKNVFNKNVPPPSGNTTV